MKLFCLCLASGPILDSNSRNKLFPARSIFIDYLSNYFPPGLTKPIDLTNRYHQRSVIEIGFLFKHKLELNRGLPYPWLSSFCCLRFHVVSKLSWHNLTRVKVEMRVILLRTNSPARQSSSLERCRMKPVSSMASMASEESSRWRISLSSETSPPDKGSPRDTNKAQTSELWVQN